MSRNAAPLSEYKKMSREMATPEETETFWSKKWENFKKRPYLTIGCTLWVLAIVKAVHGYKHRPAHLSTSRFLMHLRVRAQAMVVGSLMVGVIVNAVQEKWYPEDKEQDSSTPSDSGS